MASRPKTLAIALVPILVGTALAYGLHQTVRPLLSLMAFLSALFIQIGTNLINDALDFIKGADTKERLGPQRVTQSGLMDAKWVLRAGFFCFLISTVLAIPLVIEGGWPLVCVGLLSFLAGYAYTGGPFPLAYQGLGDLFVLIFYGWVAVGGVYYLNTGQLDWTAWIAGLQVGLLATIPIAINNLRDHTTDRKVGKKTLPVRFGPSFGKFEIAAVSLVPFAVGGIWFQQGLGWAFVLPWIALPIAIALIRRIQSNEPGVIYNRFFGLGVGLDLGFGLLLSVGLLLR